MLDTPISSRITPVVRAALPSACHSLARVIVRYTAMVRNSEYATAIAAASVAVVTPPITQARMMTMMARPGSDAMPVRTTVPQPGNMRIIELPSSRFG